MTYTTLISPAELADHLDDPGWVIVDCRFSLADPDKGRRDYLQSHVTGALYVHLDEDLCAPVVKGVTGRHPLPSIEAAAEVFGRLGIGKDTQVVGYDDWLGASGAVAARFWWMLRWLGHNHIAVLDGGWNAWIAEGYQSRRGVEPSLQCKFSPKVRLDILATAADTKAAALYPAWKVFDSRSTDRYRGENETIDPVAGHIPGAISAPYMENCTPEGKFRSVVELRERFTALLGNSQPNQTIFYCGSGVTAAHNVLALAHSGLGDGRLYPGSWSEWITDPSRGVQTG